MASAAHFLHFWRKRYEKTFGDPFDYLYAGDSVTIIAGSAFEGCSGLTSITIPSSVWGIDDYAFSGCSGLTSINYNGTKEQWKAITKYSYWNNNTGSYTVTCSDGVLTKAES
ncbi:MAG: hypothetical protein E7607_04940 [Ruminococcaceae bacterium]|nr:hypothetical protein [Oscillospiraceae bacterium]